MRDVKEALDRLLEAQEQANKRLEACCDAMEERLKRCIWRRKTETIHRMANLATLGMKKEVFTPKKLVAETGTKYSVVYRDLQTLRHLGIADRIKRGRYTIKPGLEAENLDEAIARGMMVKLAGIRPRR